MTTECREALEGLANIAGAHPSRMAGTSMMTSLVLIRAEFERVEGELACFKTSSKFNLQQCRVKQRRLDDLHSFLLGIRDAPRTDDRSSMLCDIEARATELLEEL